jgi:uncharacterized protein
MKIVIAGGSGQVGTVLCRAFAADGHEVVVLSRKPAPADWRTVAWDGATLGPWTSELNGADVALNLAGRSVNCRYTPENRRAIKQSRIDSTRVLGQAIQHAAVPPRIWLQASTATIYAHRYDVANDESTGIIGGNEPNVPDTWRFSIDVATSWEQEALAVNTPATRKVLLRSAMMMSPDRGGVFDTLLALTRRGLGGKSGNGKQYVSWIHDVDFIRSIYWLIDHDLAGPVNLAAPNPIPNAEFMKALRKAWGISVGLPANRLVLEMGAIFMRTETELILKSRRVIPGRLLQSGFKFQFPDWQAAAINLCQRWRENEPMRCNP